MDKEASLKELHATAQREFDALRCATPRHRGLFASRRLLVFSDRFMRKRGGAMALYRWIIVSPTLLTAPPEVRRAVIAHEWGHVAKGHCVATMLNVGLVLIYGASTWLAPRSWAVTLTNIGLLLVIGLIVLWTIHPKREFEADAFAARLVGADAMARGLRWIIGELRGGQFADIHLERLARLSGEASPHRPDPTPA